MRIARDGKAPRDSRGGIMSPRNCYSMSALRLDEIPRMVVSSRGLFDLFASRTDNIIYGR
jgi:hypothetical protein